MKKALIFAAALIIAAACNKMENGESTFISANEETTAAGKIEFAAAMEVPTKAYAEVTTAALNATGKSIVVSGVTDAGEVFMNGVSCAYTQSSTAGKFVPASDYYMPTGGASFYSVYPSGTISVSGTGASLSYSSDVTDDVITAATGNTKSCPVSLQYSHILSQVHVKAAGKTAGFTYKVYSITLQGAGSGTWDFSDWTATSGTKQSTWYSLAAGKDTPYVGDPKVFTDYGVDNQAFIPGSLTCTVVYDVFQDGILIQSNEKAATATLVKGKRCEVDLLLPTGLDENDKITFNLTVADWEDASAQEYTVE